MDRKTKYIVMMTKEVSTKKKHTPGTEVLEIRLDHIRNVLKIHFFLQNSLFSTLGHGSDRVNNNDDQGKVYLNWIFHDPKGRREGLRVLRLL